MAQATHTLTVNAAFLLEIKADHHELRQLMHHTSALLRRAAVEGDELDRLADLFARLRDQLAMHFSLEEAYGYFEDALIEAPRLSRRAEQLRREHRTLYAQFCSLAERAEAMLYHRVAWSSVTRLGVEYHQFSTRFHRHEMKENELILAALDDDLGAGD